MSTPDNEPLAGVLPESEVGERVAVLVPVLNRPERVRPLVESFHAAASAHDAKLYFIAQEGDSKEISEIAIQLGMGRCQLITVPPEKQSWAKKINIGYEQTREPWMLLCGDDVAFTSGWLNTFGHYASTHHDTGVIGTNDGSMSSRRMERMRQRGRMDVVRSSPHPLVSRRYIDAFGTVDEMGAVVHGGYHHNFPDTELCATARMRESFLFAVDIVVFHLHHSGDHVPFDETYRLGMSRYADDEALFNARCARFGLTP